MKIGAIDIGTNSMRLLVADYINGQLYNREKFVNTTRIGQGVDSEGYISEEAIKVAKENAQSHDATTKFIQSDIFNNIADKFDIIVSNPPYIDRKDEVTMQDNVLKYDPHLALFAEEEGMYFYRKIIEQANDYLNENGVIFFEIGYDQKDKIIKLADLNGYSAEVYKDINGRDRMAFLVRK